MPEYYSLPENPVYRQLIRRLQNEDPVEADAVVNPLIEVLLENIHYLYKHDSARKTVAVRVRDPTKPSYGLNVLDDGTTTATLETAVYTGMTEVSAVINGVEYDVKNMSVNGTDGPDGTLILRMEE